MQTATFTIDIKRARFRIDCTFILGAEYNVAFDDDDTQRRVVLYAHNGQPVADTADGTTLSLDTAELLNLFKVNGIETKCPRTITCHAAIIENGDTIATGDVQVMYSRFYTAPSGTLTAIDTKGEQGIPGIKGDKGEDGRDGIITDVSAGHIVFSVPSTGDDAGHLLATVVNPADFYALDENGQPDTTKPRWVVIDTYDGKHLFYCYYDSGSDTLSRAIDLGSVQGPKGDQGEAGHYTFDALPTLDSTNPVTSSGIFAAIEVERVRAVNAENALAAKISAVYKFKGSVATIGLLPTASAATGDVYNVEADGMNYAYNGNGVWDALGSFVDLTDYAKTAAVTKLVSDTAQALSSDLQAEVADWDEKLETKVDIEVGKGLSTYDFDNEHKSKLDSIEKGAQVNPDLSPYALTTDVNTLLANKVDKDGAKVLSTNDYTDADKTKLSGIEAGAQVNPDLTPYAKTAEVNSKLTTKVDKVEGKGLSTEDFTTQEKADLANLKAKRFDVAVDGVAITPQGGYVYIETTYADRIIQETDINGGAVGIFPKQATYIPSEVASSVNIIFLNGVDWNGTRDYLLEIDIAEGQGSITFDNPLAMPFVTASDDALALEVGHNLLSFTQLPSGRIAVNRVLLSEVS